MRAFSVSQTTQNKQKTHYFRKVVEDYGWLWPARKPETNSDCIGIPKTDPPGRQVPGDSKAPPRGSLWKTDVSKIKSKRAA